MAQKAVNLTAFGAAAGDDLIVIMISLAVHVLIFRWFVSLTIWNIHYLHYLDLFPNALLLLCLNLTIVHLFYQSTFFPFPIDLVLSLSKNELRTPTTRPITGTWIRK